MNSTKRIIIILIIGIFLLFGLFVWPSIYEYSVITEDEETIIPIRINKITGETKIIYPTTPW